MEADIVTILIGIIGGVIITAPVLWIAGRMLVGATNAKFTDAITIVVLGSIASGVVTFLLGPSLLGSIAQLVVILALIKKYYECGWGKAFAVAIVTVVIYVIILFVLSMVGISILGGF
jgi:hypothetical protein